MRGVWLSMMGGSDRTGRSEGETSPHGGASSRRSPGKRTRVASQFARATSGPRSEVPHRREMEQAFGRDFSSVDAYLGGEQAEQGLAGLGAVAAAHGSAVAFR